MNEQTFPAERRTILGKKVKQLRRAGQVPGVVYGPVVDGTVPVAVDRREFDRFYQSAGHSTLFTLKWNGGEQTVFIREVQADPVRRDPLHIDFFAPNLREALRTMVPIVLHNANDEAEGVLTQVRSEVEIEGLPTAIPHQIDADISGLAEVGDSLRAGDLTLPEGVILIADEDELLVTLSAETQEEPGPVEEEEELEEGEEAAEGEDGDEDAADASGDSEDES